MFILDEDLNRVILKQIDKNDIEIILLGRLSKQSVKVPQIKSHIKSRLESVISLYPATSIDAGIRGLRHSLLFCIVMKDKSLFFGSRSKHTIDNRFGSRDKYVKHVKKALRIWRAENGG